MVNQKLASFFLLLSFFCNIFFLLRVIDLEHRVNICNGKSKRDALAPTIPHHYHHYGHWPSDNNDEFPFAVTLKVGNNCSTSNRNDIVKQPNLEETAAALVTTSNTFYLDQLYLLVAKLSSNFVNVVTKVCNACILELGSNLNWSWWEDCAAGRHSNSVFFFEDLLIRHFPFAQLYLNRRKIKVDMGSALQVIGIRYHWKEDIIRNYPGMVDQHALSKQKTPSYHRLWREKQEFKVVKEKNCTCWGDFASRHECSQNLSSIMLQVNSFLDKLIRYAYTVLLWNLTNNHFSYAFTLVGAILLVQWMIYSCLVLQKVDIYLQFLYLKYFKPQFDGFWRSLSFYYSFACFLWYDYIPEMYALYRDPSYLKSQLRKSFTVLINFVKSQLRKSFTVLINFVWMTTTIDDSCMNSQDNFINITVGYFPGGDPQSALSSTIKVDLLGLTNPLFMTAKNLHPNIVYFTLRKRGSGKIININRAISEYEIFDGDVIDIGFPLLGGGSGGGTESSFGKTSFKAKKKRKTVAGGVRDSYLINGEVSLNMDDEDYEEVTYTGLQDGAHKCCSDESCLEAVCTTCGTGVGDCQKRCLLLKNNRQKAKGSVGLESALLIKSIATVKWCREQVEWMPNDQKLVYLRDKLAEHCTIISSGRLNINFTVGSKVAGGDVVEIKNVCRKAFAKAYNCTLHFIRTVTDDIKRMRIEDEQGDSSRADLSVIQADVIEAIQEAAYALNLPPLNDNQITNMTVPNGHKSLWAAQWMTIYFTEMACKMPNGEWQIEQLDKVDIYSDYKKAMEISKEDDYLSYSRFLQLWRDSFPNVKVKQYKQVSGKCFACTRFTICKNKAKTSFELNLLSGLHAHHRDMYMGERRVYYEQRWKAVKEPEKYLSIILDGMANHHCQLPWFGNKMTFSALYLQHLQGVITHGSEFIIGRSFANLKDDANLAIHCLLLALERRKITHGKLPDTIFVRIDGGSENANKIVLAICELLVHKKVTKEIILSRLPVGHTHEDIDGKFGNIWNGIKRKSVTSPQMYKSEIEGILNQGPLPNVVLDIFSTPNYKELLEPCVVDISAWTKGSTTQLVWKFETVALCDAFPLGVKVMYRAYSQNIVTEIVKDTNRLNPVGLKARRAKVTWHPQVTTYNANTHEGMHILKKLPRGKLLPAAFEAKSRAQLETTVRAFRNKYKDQDPDGVKDWEEFADKIAPETDQVEDYCAKIPQYIPLRDILFAFNVDKSTTDGHDFSAASDNVISNRAVVSDGNSLGDINNLVEGEEAYCLDSVQWSNRGRGKGIFKFIPSRIVKMNATETFEAAILRSALESGQDYTEMIVDELYSICSLRGIHGCSNLPKEALIRKLQEYDSGELPNARATNSAADAAVPAARETAGQGLIAAQATLDFIRDRNGGFKPLSDMTNNELKYTLKHKLGVTTGVSGLRKSDLLNKIRNEYNHLLPTELQLPIATAANNANTNMDVV